VYVVCYYDLTQEAQMYNSIADIPDWLADYMETVSKQPITEIGVDDVNAIVELLTQAGGE
jgi:hypothetical protein